MRKSPSKVSEGFLGPGESCKFLCLCVVTGEVGNRSPSKVPGCTDTWV